ncbi:hypothetical protein LEM8419_00686 [Neolewinella maritima]|uniref:Outer membrane protein beta-barrel domain-containing protein n=1 Tax=Neolewinella maritima TaxID=1383882 RepID=A0ABN8F2P6_9BACT|nr:hypothetical protein [Neolewinella maritima]CAH0999388.1 hypothetical protein LEM8419_00686 [Neolewinella maritima]
MKRLLPLLLFFFLGAEAAAQFSVRAAVYSGPLRIEESGETVRGWSNGLGLAVAYHVNARWGTPSLSLSRESFGGFNVVRNFNGIVPALDPSAPATVVSVVLHQRGFSAYHLRLSVERYDFETIPRLKWGGGVGVLAIGERDPVRYDIVEQTLAGEILPSSDTYGFFVEEGRILRVDQGRLRTAANPQLGKYRLTTHLYLAYQLSEKVQLVYTYQNSFRPIGKRYGPSGEQYMLGELQYLTIGLVGTVLGRERR